MARRAGDAHIRVRSWRWEALRVERNELVPHIDIEILAPFAEKCLAGSRLTPAERAEVLRMAQGFACKDSAGAAGVSPETIRARRKRIYRKLELTGSGELISTFLAQSLRMLATGERVQVTQQPAAAMGASTGAVAAQ
jgi:DNA-binding CsgD family transcriptional regulator